MKLFNPDGNGPPTIAMIEEDIRGNPPGQGILYITIQFAHNATYYLPWLLEELRYAKLPWWRKLIGQKKKSWEQIVKERQMDWSISHGFVKHFQRTTP